MNSIFIEGCGHFTVRKMDPTGIYMDEMSKGDRCDGCLSNDIERLIPSNKVRAKWRNCG